MAQKDLYRLQLKLQNKCARLVYRMPKSTHVTPLLNDLHWLRIEKRIIFKTLLYLYKSLNGLCPQYITDCLVVKRPPPRSVTTRSCHGLDLLIPKTTRRSGDRAYSVAAATLWNKLPISIRGANDVKMSRHIYLSSIPFFSGMSSSILLFVISCFVVSLRFESSGKGAL